MLHVDSSDEFRRSGRRLVTDRKHPNRFQTVSEQIAALPTALTEGPTEPPPPPPKVLALAGRSESGFHVQLLWNADERQAYVTAVLDGKSQTFAVPNEHAMEAFNHPFCFGCTLDL